MAHINLPTVSNTATGISVAGTIGSTAGATTGGLTTAKAEATANLTGATTDIEVNVPANSRIQGVQLRVDAAIKAITGTSWSAAFKTGSTQAIATGQAFTKNTKVNKHYDCKTDADIVASETDITITPNDGTFTTTAATVSLNAGGSGYAAEEVLTITNGNNDATYTVDSVDGSGVVLTGHLTAEGTGITVASGCATSYGGAGTGCKINILTINQGVIRAIVFYEAFNTMADA